jgi:hypothetical protein
MRRGDGDTQFKFQPRWCAGQGRDMPGRAGKVMVLGRVHASQRAGTGAGAWAAGRIGSDQAIGVRARCTGLEWRCIAIPPSQRPSLEVGRLYMGEHAERIKRRWAWAEQPNQSPSKDGLSALFSFSLTVQRLLSTGCSGYPQTECRTNVTHASRRSALVSAQLAQLTEHTFGALSSLLKPSDLRKKDRFLR